MEVTKVIHPLVFVFLSLSRFLVVFRLLRVP